MAPRPLPDGRLCIDETVLLDLPTAADRLHLSTRSVRRLLRDGELGSLLHGGRRMIAATEITDYIARRVTAGARQRAALARAHRRAERAAG